MRLPLFLIPAIVLTSGASLCAVPAGVWDDAFLKAVPEVFPAETIHASDERIRALFYSSVPFRKGSTRVFAWLGVPNLADGERAPGILLLHGGGGTAFESWVKLWLDRGYAAIAIDHFGCLPLPEDANPRPRNPDGGPPGGGVVFSQLDEPLADQWPFHAVAAASRALSLLRVDPRVDPQRIGVTGISWGGYLACLLAGVDDRLRFSIPVYGCGFYDETTFGGVIAKLPPDQSALWWRQWDASLYLPSARVPMLWVNGTNDRFFWLPAWQRSYRLTAADSRTLSLQVRMPHGHPPAGDPPEVLAFADQLLRGSSPLTKVRHDGREEKKVTVSWQSTRPVIRAELNYTTEATGPWAEREWKTEVASITGETATAILPDDAAAYFMNLKDDSGCSVSTEHELVPLSANP